MITRDDLISYGMGRQFLGRFSDITYLNSLDEDTLTNILLKSNASITKNYTSLFKMSSTADLTVDENGAKAIARKALNTKVGARGLNHIVINILSDAIFSIDREKHFTKMLITEGEDGQPKVVTHFSLKEKSFSCISAKINCHPTGNRVEGFADYILSANPLLAKENIRTIRAAHSLLCSIIMYILLEMNEEYHNIDMLKRILRREINIEFRLFKEKIKDRAMDYNFYFNKFEVLDHEKRAANLAYMAVVLFMETPEYKLKPLA